MGRTPVWQSEEWQQAKEERLKDMCQQCGSQERLSLVHLWKPPKYRQIRYQVEQEIINNMINNKQIKQFDTQQLDELRNACPSCKSINLRKRKTKQPPFKCGRCSHEFSNPDEIMVRDDKLFRQAYRSWKDKHLAEMEQEIETEINKIQEKNDKKYRSGEGTTTYCGKCAFLFTQKGKILCQTCKSNYHKRNYDQCYQCYQKDLLVICDKCQSTKIQPQPGGINICEECYETMWDDLTQ